MKYLDDLGDRFSAQWTCIFDQLAASFANAGVTTRDKDSVDRFRQTNRAVVACFAIVLS